MEESKANSSNTAEKTKNQRAEIGNNEDDDVVMKKSTWDGNTFIYGGGKVDENIKKRIQDARVADWVTEINDNAFEDCIYLISIIIPPQVQRIGSHSFKYCTRLERVTFFPGQASSSSSSSLLTVIANGAFGNCKSLSSIVLPNSVTEIGIGAFYQCEVLMNVVLPKSGPSVVMKTTFCGCTQLESIILSDTIAKIDSNAFENCSNLKVILIPDSVEEIGEYAFYSCVSLHSIMRTHPKQQRQEQLDMISSILDSSGTPLSTAPGTIELPESLKFIRPQAFFCCRAIASIKMADSVAHIGRYAFSHCSHLENVHLSRTLQKLPDFVFEYTMLKEITLPASLLWIGEYAFRNCKMLQHVVLPGTLEAINDGAFFDCVALSGRMEIPNSVTFIGKDALRGCKQLEHVTIPNSICEIHHRTFLECTGLRSVDIPDTVISIGIEAFKGCSSLISINLSAHLRYVKKRAFYGCRGLSETFFSTDAINYHCDLNRDGRKFLMRNGNDDRVAYPSSLWPLILHRAINQKKFPKDRICESSSSRNDYTKSIDRRRVSIVYHLMTNGVAMDF